MCLDDYWNDVLYLYVIKCLSAGSSIMNREAESGAMRPLARALTKSLEKVRGLLRDASLCSDQTPPCLRSLISSLCTFDHLLAEFELRYVSAMVPVKTAHEYELQQLMVVLFSETLQRYIYFHLSSSQKLHISFFNSVFILCKQFRK